MLLRLLWHQPGTNDKTMDYHHSMVNFLPQTIWFSDTAKTFEVLPDSRTTKSSSFTSPTEVLQDETD